MLCRELMVDVFASLIYINNLNKYVCKSLSSGKRRSRSRSSSRPVEWIVSIDCSKDCLVV